MGRRQRSREQATRALGLSSAALVLLAAGSSRAHPLDLGYLRLEATGTTVSAVLDLDARGVAQLLGVEAVALDAALVAQRAATLAEATYRSAPLVTDRGPCRWTGASATLSGATVHIVDRAECPAGSRALRWAFPFVQRAWVASTFQLLVRAHVFGAEHVTTIDRRNPEIVLEGAASVGFGQFVSVGVAHIGAAPREWIGKNGLKLADGIDHILFLLGLILGGGTLLRLVSTATGFTVGHSITLALATLRIVRPPARLIESAIALSIAFVAVEAFRGKSQKSLWKVATGFGLVHGFGFANALTQLNLSGLDMAEALVGYNLGVELGQIAIVLVLAPPLFVLARRAPRVFGIVVRVLAAVIFVAGSYWFFRRAFGL